MLVGNHAPNRQILVTGEARSGAAIQSWRTAIQS
jgi:hypothetical protein